MRIVLFIVILMVFFTLRSEAGPSPGGLGVGVGASLQVVPISHKTISFRGGVFAAKFLCGTIAPGGTPQVPPPGFPLVPGTYLTAINIYNPNTFQVRFAKKAIITNPQGQRRGQVSTQVIETLGSMQGLEVDCCNIVQLFTPGTVCTPDDIVFFKGFVDIAINPFVPLEVVGVYTLKNVVIERGNSQ